MAKDHSTIERPLWRGKAVLVIKKDKIECFKKAVSRILIPTISEEGCVSYEGYQVLDERGLQTNQFEFHELWKSKEAMMIDHKEKSPHMQKFFQEIKLDTEDSYVEKFEVSGHFVIKLKHEEQ